jgi:hypothetical protein
MLYFAELCEKDKNMFTYSFDTKHFALRKKVDN